MVLANSIVTVLYYVISLFFLFIMFRNFKRTKNPQDALLYCIIMVPFVLRILRIK